MTCRGYGQEPTCQAAQHMAEANHAGLVGGQDERNAMPASETLAQQSVHCAVVLHQPTFPRCCSGSIHTACSRRWPGGSCWCRSRGRSCCAAQRIKPPLLPRILGLCLCSRQLLPSQELSRTAGCQLRSQLHGRCLRQGSCSLRCIKRLLRWAWPCCLRCKTCWLTLHWQAAAVLVLQVEH